MRVSRIYVADTLAENQTIKLSDKTSHYLLKVLRLKPGAALTLFNGNGIDYKAELLGTEQKTARIRITGQSLKEKPAALKIHLGIGLSKGDRLDFALQKATELGVCEISLIDSEYSTIRLNQQRLEKKLQHWQGVTISACEQSGRRYLPQIHGPATLNGWLANLDDGLKLVLAPTAENPLKSFEPQEKIFLLAGPEGGLSEQEMRLSCENGFHPVRLGGHILRTETAPLAAISAVQTLWGDFS